jgi:hypothetical protein
MSDLLIEAGSTALSIAAIIITSVAGASQLERGQPIVAAFLFSLTLINAILFAVNLNYHWR